MLPNTRRDQRNPTQRLQPNAAEPRLPWEASVAQANKRRPAHMPLTDKRGDQRVLAFRPPPAATLAARLALRAQMERRICMRGPRPSSRAGSTAWSAFSWSRWARGSMTSRHDAPLPGGGDVGQVVYVSLFRIAWTTEGEARGAKFETDLEPRSVCEWPLVHWGKGDQPRTMTSTRIGVLTPVCSPGSKAPGLCVTGFRKHYPEPNTFQCAPLLQCSKSTTKRYAENWRALFYVFLQM